jgi:RecA/RadA recombinase
MGDVSEYATVVTRHPSDTDLIARIRAKLASGSLPRGQALEMFGGPSSGQFCSACDERIAAAAAEIEVTGADLQQRFFHHRCYNLLAAERLLSSINRA